MALTDPPAAGAPLLAATLAALALEPRMLLAKQAADLLLQATGATMQNTDLALPVVASAVYAFRVAGQYTTNATPDIKIGFTFPTGLTMDYGLLGFSTADVWQASRAIQTTVLQLGAGGSSFYLAGTVTVSSTAGTLTLQAAQNTANASVTNLEAGSVMTLVRVS